jgi:hypothetical protein
MPNPHNVQGTFSATGQSDPIDVRGPGKVDLSLQGDSDDFVVTVQRKRPSDSTWRDVEEFTGSAEEIGDVAAGVWQFRLDCTNMGTATAVDYELSSIG